MEVSLEQINQLEDQGFAILTTSELLSMPPAAVLDPDPKSRKSKYDRYRSIGKRFHEEGKYPLPSTVIQVLASMDLVCTETDSEGNEVIPNVPFAFVWVVDAARLKEIREM